MEFTGYHGTRRVQANNICRNGFDLSRCKVGWIGKGVYFFDGDKSMAVDFARRTKRTDDVRVVRCKFTVPDDHICELSLPTDDGAIEFHEYRLVLLQKLHDNDIDARSPEEIDTDGKVLELMCEQYGYHLVRKATYTYSELDSFQGRELRSYIPNAFELCLRDTRYIQQTDVII